MEKILARQCGHCKVSLYISIDDGIIKAVNGTCYFVINVIGKMYSRWVPARYKAGTMITPGHYVNCKRKNKVPTRRDSIPRGLKSYVYCTKCHSINNLNIFKETKA